MIKNQRGITMASLIITIVVITILTGFIVNIVIDSAMTDDAKEVVNKTMEHENTMNEIRSEVRNMINN